MRARFAAAVAAVLAAGGIIVGETCTCVIPDWSEPEPGLANLWVDDDGGTCTRSSEPAEYDDGSACGSFDAANDALQNGELALVKEGTYSGQTMTGGNSRIVPATIRVAEGETVTLTGTLSFSGTEYLIVDGDGDRFGANARLVTTTGAGSGSPGGAAQTENQYPISVNQAEHVTVKGADFGGWHITDSRSVTVKWNDIGPCHSSDGSGTNSGSPGCDNGSVEYCEVTQLSCEGYNTGHLVDGNRIHDFGCDQNFYNGSGSDDCHWECMYVSYAHNLTIRGNIFVNCANGGNIFNTFSNGGGSFTADFGYTNYVIENNVFTQACSNSSAPCGGRLDSASGVGHCNIFSAGNDFAGTIIRFNTFLVSSLFDLECVSAFGSPGALIASSDQFRVYGNILKFSSAATCGNNWAANQGGANAERDYNLFYTGTFTCGTNGLNVGSNLSGIVVSDSNTAPNAALAEGATDADNFVPVSEVCPSTDILGNPRAVSGSCDAGAYER